MATVALLGAGFIGNLHAANLAVHPHAELSWVFDPQSELAKLTARKYHGIAASSARQVFADPSVDAVIIASTHRLPCRTTRSCVRAPKACTG